jgi:hypothetical protein
MNFSGVTETATGKSCDSEALDLFFSLLLHENKIKRAKTERYFFIFLSLQEFLKVSLFYKKI